MTTPAQDPLQAALSWGWEIFGEAAVSDRKGIEERLLLPPPPPEG